MRKAVLFLVAFLSLTALRAPQAADERTEEAAREKYESAFDEGRKARERVQTLETVVRDYCNTSWGDDALWLLGELADRYGYRKRAIHYRRELMALKETPALEAFTRSQRIYRRSRIPQILSVLNRSGHSHKAVGGKVLIFNPLPMAVHEKLASDYARLGMSEAALAHYRQALAGTPSECLYAEHYRKRIAELEEKLPPQGQTPEQEQPGREDAGPAEPDTGERHDARQDDSDESEQQDEQRHAAEDAGEVGDEGQPAASEKERD